MKEKQILLSDYIKVYDKVLKPDLCDKLINMFDLCDKKIYDDDCKKFSQINLNDNSSFFPDFSRVVNVFAQCAEAYRRDVHGTDFMPPTIIMESIKVNRYELDGYFKEHADANEADTMMRYLSMFVCLTDSGGVEFFGNKIPAETGKVICFPPNWMFPYSGYVGDKPRYIMESYLHIELPSVKKAREKKSIESAHDSDE